MQLFRDTKYDFLGKKWIFISLSLLLTLAGLVSLILKHGPLYSVDFRGGAVMNVQWDSAPPVSRILSLLPGTSVVQAHDLTGSNEVLISAPLAPDTKLDDLQSTIERALTGFGPHYKVGGIEAIGPQIGADLRRQAVLATATASAGMLGYLAWRFRWIYGTPRLSPCFTTP